MGSKETDIPINYNSCSKQEHMFEMLYFRLFISVSCPDYYQNEGGVCLRVKTGHRMDKNMAEALCKKDRAFLAAPTNLLETVNLVNFAKSNNINDGFKAWLGITDKLQNGM